MLHSHIICSSRIFPEPKIMFLWFVSFGKFCWTTLSICTKKAPFSFKIGIFLDNICMFYPHSVVWDCLKNAQNHNYSRGAYSSPQTPSCIWLTSLCNFLLCLSGFFLKHIFPEHIYQIGFLTRNCLFVFELTLIIFTCGCQVIWLGLCWCG